MNFSRRLVTTDTNPQVAEEPDTRKLGLQTPHRQFEAHREERGLAVRLLALVLLYRSRVLRP